MDKTSTSSVYSRSDYTIGWVCALSTELTAATAMLDSNHDLLSIPSGDDNSYTLGSIGKHNIVIACLPKGKYGTTSAAVVATQMLESFPSVRFGLMVGIGGGIPSGDNDIRLGDVVVSTPTGSFPGVVQWDMGKAMEGGSFERTGSLNSPPRTLLTALQRLETRHDMEGSSIERYLDEMIEKWPRMKSKHARHDSLKDILFTSDNPHQRGTIANERPRREKENCNSCDMTKIVERERRNGIEVHYGLIASGNKVIKDAILRDKLNSDFGGNVLCVEMEAAGLMDTFPCLVIRGICDYADSHKNDAWQGHAAATAAAFAKELLSVIPAHEVEQMDSIKILVNKVGEISEDVKRIHQGQEKHVRNEIFEWLTPVNYDAQHHEHLSQRSPGSGEWFLKAPNFLKFLSGNEKTLLCQGNPGAGKTILTSVVIDHLQNWRPDNDALSDKRVAIAFIYFDFIRKESQRTIDIIASLVQQLAQDQPSLSASIKELYGKYGNIPASSRSDKDIPEFSKVLKSLISEKPQKTLIIIDALDECQVTDALLAEIFTILEDTEAKLFATSRPNENVEKRFKKGLLIHISAAGEDVKSYIQGRLPEFKVLSDENQDLSHELRTQLKEKIVEKISSAIDGIFLLAKFYADSLRAKTTPAQIIHTLKLLPRGPSAYQQAYEKTINRIRGQQVEHQRLARRTLQWLACAAREIRASELRHALAIRNDSDSLPNEEELESTNVMIDVCMGLVIVERESGVIRLLHHTALEYLRQNMACLWSLEDPEALETLLPPPKSSKDATYKAHQDIAAICIKYLSFEWPRFLLTHEKWGFNTKLDEYPFLKYTKQNWDYHWREGFNETGVPASMYQMTAAFLENKYTAAIINTRKITKKSLITMKMLHFVAFFGLTSMVDTCLENGHDINTRTSCGRNALCFALQNKHEGTCRALLERGAKDVIFEDDYGKISSLGLAIRDRMSMAVDLLLDDNFGARVNPEVGKVNISSIWTTTTPLLLVKATEGNVKMVNLLLSYGSDVNVRCERANDCDQVCKWMPPLFVAAEVGDLDMAKMLLERKANPNAIYATTGYRNIPGVTPLISAVIEGDEAVVEYLLGVDNIAVNAADTCFRTPFHWAISKGNRPIADILQRHGGKLNGADTDLDPGLPIQVSSISGTPGLICGRPGLIRFWTLERMPIDVAHDSYGVFEDSYFIENFLQIYNKESSTMIIPWHLAKPLNKIIEWEKCHNARKVLFPYIPITRYDARFAEEIRTEGIWDDMERLAEYLSIRSLQQFFLYYRKFK